MVENGPEPSQTNRSKAGAAKSGWAHDWAWHDWVAAAGLFAATAAVVLWQNAHVAVLFDLSYILNTAERIALGQVPYRDFPLAHAPLTFLIQAAIIRLTGRVIFHHVLYTAIVGGLGTVLTWRISLGSLRGRIAGAWMVALLLAAPLAFLGVYSIVPNPEYDCDCGFWLVVAVWFFVEMDRRKSAAFALAAGMFACMPLFFKQNMGLPFLLTAIGAVLVLLVRLYLGIRNRHPSGAKAPIFLGTISARLKPCPDTSRFPDASFPAGGALDEQGSWPTLKAGYPFPFFGGVCAAIVTALAAIHWTAGLGNYLHWTIQYARQRRMPGLSLMLDVYRDPTLAWTLPCVVLALILLRVGIGKTLWARIAAFILLAAPFLFALSSLLRFDDADERGDALLALWPLLLVLAAVLVLVNLFALWRGPSLRLFLPLVLLAAIHGTFLSQQLWGSTYGIWPLLILLIAELLAFLGEFLPRATGLRWFVPALATVVALTLFVCGGFYAASEERLSYANLPDGPPMHSAFPVLAGLATPGPYVPEIDELLRYAQANIPFDDGIAIVPGEEPFYFATGRAPQFPVPFFDPTIDPYSPAEIAALIQTRNIRWLIVKTDVQTKEDPTPDRAELIRLLLPQFTPVAHLRGYDVYRVKQRG